MKRILLSAFLLIITLVSGAQYRIMGYYPNSAYGDYVIIYGYYDSNGIFTLSHCRTNAIAQDIYSNRIYLDINTCTFRRVDQGPSEVTPAGIPPPPPPEEGQKAF